MGLIRYRPASPLAECIACFWWSNREHADPATERMLPSGNAHLIFALHDARFSCGSTQSGKRSQVWSRGIVHGPQSSYYDSGAKPAGAVVGVSFRPGAAGALLGVPLSEFTDHHVTLDEIWGRRGEELRERLMAAERPNAIFRLLEQELTRRLRHPIPIHPVVAHALAYSCDGWSPLRVADVQRAAGCSPRHFIALFHSAVGLTPKHFYRVQRFTAVLQRLADGNIGGLADLARSVGYCDQAHLTREFREFAGITPTTYRPRNRDSVLHQRLQVKNLLDPSTIVPDHGHS